MPLTELIRYFNAADNAGDSTLYPTGERVAAWHRGLHLGSRFQPIVDLRRQTIVGHRASLTARAATGGPPPPENLYALCPDAPAIVHFDRLCRTLHALNFLVQRRRTGGYLQLAVDRRHLLAVPSQHGLVYEAILKRCGLAPEDIVLEIGDLGNIPDAHLTTALNNYRQRGYRLALDSPDNAPPNGLPIDILRLSSLDQARRLPAGAVRQVAGIDRGDDLASARALDIELGLGRLFGSPQDDCHPTHNGRRVAYNEPPTRSIRHENRQ